MREDFTNQHGVQVPTETEAVKQCDKDRRRRVRGVLRQWGKTDREVERLEREYMDLVGEVEALRGLKALTMDGMPHGNMVTHPTEDTAIAIMDMMERRQDRLADIIKRIGEGKRLLARIEYAMKLARNADLLRRNYHDCVRPMEKLAEEFHVSVRTAWNMENEGVDSIADIL